MNVSESDIAARLDGTRLREGAYAQDLSLTEIRIPEGVTDIGEVAFLDVRTCAKYSFPKVCAISAKKRSAKRGFCASPCPRARS